MDNEHRWKHYECLNDPALHCPLRLPMSVSWPPALLCWRRLFCLFLHREAQEWDMTWWKGSWRPLPSRSRCLFAYAGQVKEGTWKGFWSPVNPCPIRSVVLVHMQLWDCESPVHRCEPADPQVGVGEGQCTTERKDDHSMCEWVCVSLPSPVLLLNVSEPLRGERIVCIKVKEKSKIGGEML